MRAEWRITCSVNEREVKQRGSVWGAHGDRVTTTLNTEQIFKRLRGGRKTVVEGLGVCEIGSAMLGVRRRCTHRLTATSDTSSDV